MSSGLLIIHKQMPQLPQHGVLLTDWFHVDYTVIYSHRTNRGSGDLEYSFDERNHYADGGDVATIVYVSSLLGGRGRWPEHLPYPLSEYQLTPNVETRFRLVCAASEYSYEVLADGHSITVIALDGYDIQPLTVDSFFVSPGETIDFLLVADRDTAKSGRYWLRARTLGVSVGSDVVEVWWNLTMGVKIRSDLELQPWNVTHEAKAILAYDNETGTDPTSSERHCTVEKLCRIFNCPFAFYPDDLNRTCLALTDARSAYTSDWLDSEFGLSNVDYNEYFLNFCFVGGTPNVNAVTFMLPRGLLRPGLYDNDPQVTQCPEDAECQSNGCSCTQVKQMPYNATIQVRRSICTKVKCIVYD